MTLLLLHVVMVLLLLHGAAGWVAPPSAVRLTARSRRGGVWAAVPCQLQSRSCGASVVLFQSSSSSSQDGIISTKRANANEMDAKQRDFVLGYLNKHHADLLVAFAAAFSPLGTEMAQANVWSGGSFSIESAVATNIDDSSSFATKNLMTLDVMVVQRGKQPAAEQRTVRFPLTADPVRERWRLYDSAAAAAAVPQVDPDRDVNARLAIDDLVRKLCRLCWIVKMPAVSGKLIQLAFQLDGAGVGKLPENMYVRSTWRLALCVRVYIYYMFVC